MQTVAKCVELYRAQCNAEHALQMRKDEAERQDEIAVEEDDATEEQVVSDEETPRVPEEEHLAVVNASMKAKRVITYFCLFWIVIALACALDCAYYGTIHPSSNHTIPLYGSYSLMDDDTLASDLELEIQAQNRLKANEAKNWDTAMTIGKYGVEGAGTFALLHVPGVNLVTIITQAYRYQPWRYFM